RAAEQRYELATSQVEHAASSPGATAIIDALPRLRRSAACPACRWKHQLVLGAVLKCSESRPGPLLNHQRSDRQTGRRSPSFDHARPSLERVIRHQRKTLVVLPKLDRTRTERHALPDGALEILRSRMQRLEFDLRSHSPHDRVDRQEALRRIGIEIVIVEDASPSDPLAAGADGPPRGGART